MTVSIKQNTSTIPSQNADENALWTKSLPLYTVVMSLWSTFVRKTPLYNTAGERGRVLFSATVTMVKGLGNISTSRSLLPTLGPILTATPVLKGPDNYRNKLLRHEFILTTCS